MNTEYRGDAVVGEVQTNKKLNERKNKYIPSGERMTELAWADLHREDIDT